jgi:hypothetical protein
VYLVVMRGDFTYTGPRLGGVRPPAGSYLAVTIDRLVYIPARSKGRRAVPWR